MTERFIFAGYGGQGVLTLGQIFAKLGLEENKEVTWMPAYGAEMRGGTANCSVIISDNLIASPFVASNSDYVFVMNEISLEKFEDAVRPGGRLIINSSLVEKEVKRDDIEVLKIDATNIANKMGNPKVQNMIMIAGYLYKNENYKLEDLRKVFEKHFEGKKSSLIDLNMKAIEEGLKSIK